MKICKVKKVIKVINKSFLLFFQEEIGLVPDQVEGKFYNDMNTGSKVINCTSKIF